MANSEKRYQVFVSSTYRDLGEERQQVMQALLELDCIVAGMELFLASDDDQWTLIKRVIDDCDYYLVIIGGRYGSTDATGISYTEKEYDYAVENGKPVISFLHAEPEKLEVGKSEIDADSRQRLEAFRAKAQQRMCRYWRTAEELGGIVSRSYIKLTKSHAAIGWVSADNAVPIEAQAELAQLRNQVTELRLQLERGRVSAPEGTDRLAQGGDLCPINFDFAIREAETQTFRRERRMARLSWDEIFASLGPLMLNESAETKLQSAFQNFVAVRLRESGDLPSGILSGSASSDDFQSVKLQLLALGLIQKSERRRGVNDSNIYWSLTPYGESKLIQLRAVQRAP